MTSSRCRTVKSASGRTCRRRWVSAARCGSTRRRTTTSGSNFPVLYLFHGGGDIESGWTMIGRANNILDNLIAEGKARPMVVVMPLGHAVQSFWAGPARPSPNAPAPGARGAPGSRRRRLVSISSVASSSRRSCRWSKQTYKVSKRPDDRAIGGLSMGGGLTMNVAFNRPELFRHVVIMSSGAANARADVSVVLREPRQDQPAVQDVLDCGRQRRRARRRRESRR